MLQVLVYSSNSENVDKYNYTATESDSALFTYVKNLQQLVKFCENNKTDKFYLHIRSIEDFYALQFIKKNYPKIPLVVITSKQINDVIDAVKETEFVLLPQDMKLEEFSKIFDKIIPVQINS